MVRSDPNRTVRIDLGVVDDREIPFILAVDPGGTTGYALYDPITGKVECSQIGPHAHHLELENTILTFMDLAEGNSRPLVVLYEQFEFRQDYGADKVFRAVTALVNTLRSKKEHKLSEIIRELENILEFRTNRDKLVLISREYIGVIRACAARNAQTIRVESQSASEALWFIKDDKLQALGWYEPTVAMPHARDALRHLARTLLRTYKMKAIIRAVFNS